MYKFSPSHKNPIAAILTAILSAAFAVCFMIPATSYRSALQLAGIFFASAALYVFIFYIMRGYRYELESDPKAEGNITLTITECLGNRRVVVCRIGLGETSKFEKYDPKHPPKNAKIYNYCVDIRPDAYLLWLENDPLHDGDKPSAVLFMPDEQMVKIIENVFGK